MSYFPEEDFTVINLVIAHAQFIFIRFIRLFTLPIPPSLGTRKLSR